jgi:NADH dehydrogenase
MLTLSDGSQIMSKQVIWAAGVTGNLLAGLENDVIVKGNRIKVNRYNEVVETEGVFAIGDIAYMVTPKYPNGHPQVANVAINQGRNLAANIDRIENGTRLKEYEYKDLGSLATVGRNKAVVDLSGIRFKGYFAWFFWMFLHLMLILRVRNKLIIFINWAGNYMTQNSSLRLILKGEKE